MFKQNIFNKVLGDKALHLYHIMGHDLSVIKVIVQVATSSDNFELTITDRRADMFMLNVAVHNCA